MDAFKCNSKELTTNSVFGARGHQSFGMHMPSSSLHQSCDSVAHRVSFTLCCSCHKVLSAVFFGLSFLTFLTFLTSIAPLSSSYAGRVTVPSFISTHPTTGNPVVPHASQPPVSALSAQSLFDSPFTTIDQQPDLGAFGWESICSRPQLSTNTGKMVTK